MEGFGFLLNWAKRRGKFSNVISLILCSIALLSFIKVITKTNKEKLHETLQSPSSALTTKNGTRIDSKLDLQNLYKYYESTGQLEVLNPLTLNNTQFAESQLIIFNRVPKVGSEMFMGLLEKLGERNNFTGFKDPPLFRAHAYLDEASQKRMAMVLSDLPTPSVYSKHLSFIDFTKFDLPKPIYINMVRNPIDRVISWFYYIRTPWNYIERKLQFPECPLPDLDWIKTDYEQCVKQNLLECNYAEGGTVTRDHRQQSLYFCGHDEECKRFNSKTAFERAKHTVETEYSVVGVLEDLETTLAVFEKYIPRFFAGATQIYNENKEHFRNINRNSFKPPVSEEIKNILRKNFTRELEFYEFCKKRLYTQFIAANLGNKSCS